MKNIKYIAVAFLCSGMLSAQSIDINAMPKSGPTPTINIAKPKTFRLKNGLTVLVVENHKLPRVNVSLTIDRPPVYEGEITGVGQIMAGELGNGTKTLSKDEFNKKVDFFGANLNFGVGGAYANTLSKYFPQVMKLMADAIINPKFSAEEIKKSKDRTLEALKIDEKSAQSIIKNVSYAVTYGKKTALGEFVTKESVEKIQPKDVQDFYDKYYTPNHAYLVIAGDVKYHEVKKLIESEFSKWRKSSVRVPEVEEAKNAAVTEINIVDVPTAVQSVIELGNITKTKMKDPQYFAGKLANYILGGGGEGRLFMNLREKNGFTYGAYSNLSTSKYSPHFNANASVRNEVTDKAVQEFMNELKGIMTIKPEELQNAKAKLKGNFIMSLENPKTIADFAVSQLIHNLPDDFYSNYLKSIDRVTLEDVSNVAKANILPNNTRIFIAGKVADIAENVEKLGYPVRYYDRYANQIAKPEIKKIDANVTVESVGKKYIDAIGGRANVEKIKSLTTRAKGNVQGMELELVRIQARGGKLLEEIKMNGNTMQKTVFDGTNGYTEMRGQKTPFSEEEKKKFKEKGEIFAELVFGKNNSYSLKGIENVKDEEVYAVESGGRTSYYSVKKGLKVGEMNVQKMGEHEMVEWTYFSEHKEVSGVQLPFKMVSNVGGMEFSFDVKSYEINKAKDADFK